MDGRPKTLFGPMTPCRQIAIQSMGSSFTGNSVDQSSNSFLVLSALWGPEKRGLPGEGEDHRSLHNKKFNSQSRLYLCYPILKKPEHMLRIPTRVAHVDLNLLNLMVNSIAA